MDNVYYTFMDIPQVVLARNELQEDYFKFGGLIRHIPFVGTLFSLPNHFNHPGSVIPRRFDKLHHIFLHLNLSELNSGTKNSLNKKNKKSSIS